MRLTHLTSLGLFTSAWTAGLSSRQEATFENPVIYEDFPDNDVSVGPDGAYYFSASNFHYSPGAPILRSEDLVNWELIGHSIPRLEFGTGYDLPEGERSYRGGTWASTLRYRESNGLWYWIGCTNFWNTWVFTAEDVAGPWELSTQLESGGTCYYDNGLLIDDQDTMYVVYGSGNVSVAQLSEDGLSVVRDEVVFSAADAGADSIEGNRMYQIDGNYYVLNDRPGSTTYIWKSDSPWGPYESKILVDNIGPPLEAGNSPHQGSLIETPDGDWYFMSFTWAYPAGRMPVLAPITWGDDGFPIFVEGEEGGWGRTYPLPLPEVPTPSWLRTYNFEGPELPPHFEWNHNPDNEAWSVNNGLTLSTASVTEDIYQARNTLTHRIHGEYPVGTIELDFTNALPGDRFGLSTFRDRSAYIGIHLTSDSAILTANHNMTIDEWSGEPLDPGAIQEELPLPAGTTKIWLRTELDARPHGNREADFFYSLDGETFEPFGPTYELYGGWAFFIAYRFGIFNFATEELGGSIDVLSMTVA